MTSVIGNGRRSNGFSNPSPSDDPANILCATCNHHLRCQVRIKAGRDPDPTVAIMDSQSVKTV